MNQSSLLEYLLTIKGSYKTQTKGMQQCQFPGCEATDNIEQHHLNPRVNLNRKDLSKYSKSLLVSKRKTVSVCRKHHMILHKRRILQN